MLTPVVAHSTAALTVHLQAVSQRKSAAVERCTLQQ
jgi:hypothetical protein